MRHTRISWILIFILVAQFHAAYAEDIDALLKTVLSAKTFDEQDEAMGSILESNSPNLHAVLKKLAIEGNESFSLQSAKRLLREDVDISDIVKVRVSSWGDAGCTNLMGAALRKGVIKVGSSEYIIANHILSKIVERKSNVLPQSLISAASCAFFLLSKTRRLEDRYLIDQVIVAYPNNTMFWISVAMRDADKIDEKLIKEALKIDVNADLPKSLRVAAAASLMRRFPEKAVFIRHELEIIKKSLVPIGNDPHLATVSNISPEWLDALAVLAILDFDWARDYTISLLKEKDFRIKYSAALCGIIRWPKDLVDNLDTFTGEMRIVIAALIARLHPKYLGQIEKVVDKAALDNELKRYNEKGMFPLFIVLPITHAYNWAGRTDSR